MSWAVFVGLLANSSASYEGYFIKILCQGFVVLETKTYDYSIYDFLMLIFLNLAWHCPSRRPGIEFDVFCLVFIHAAVWKKSIFEQYKAFFEVMTAFFLKQQFDCRNNTVS